MRKLILLGLLLAACTHYPTPRYIHLKTTWNKQYPEVKFYLVSARTSRRHDFKYNASSRSFRVANIPPGKYHLYAYFEIGGFTLAAGSFEMENEDLEIFLNKQTDIPVYDLHDPLR